jgi:hypothetical protein
MKKDEKTEYIICKSCGQKYDTNMDRCPTCKLKPTNDDYIYLCNECGKRLSGKNVPCYTCLKKKFKKTKEREAYSQLTNGEIIAYTFGIIFLISSILKDSNIVDKIFSISFSLSFFKILYEFVDSKLNLRARFNMKSLRVFAPILILVLWILFSPTFK